MAATRTRLEVLQEVLMGYFGVTQSISEWLDENEDSQEIDFSDLTRLVARRQKIMEDGTSALEGAQDTVIGMHGVRERCEGIAASVSRLDEENGRRISKMIGEYKEVLKNKKQARDTVQAYQQQILGASSDELVGNLFNKAN